MKWSNCALDDTADVDDLSNKRKSLMQLIISAYMICHAIRHNGINTERRNYKMQTEIYRIHTYRILLRKILLCNEFNGSALPTLIQSD